MAIITKRLSWPFTTGKPLPLLPQKQLIIPSLPTEAINCILLHVSDSATLKSCSLASTKFRGIAEKLLFACITIRLSSSHVNPYHAFLAFIGKSGQRLAPFVHSLKLFDFYLEDCTSTWLAYDGHILPRIVACLANLWHLGIYAHRDISPALRTMVTGVSELRSLTGRGFSIDMGTILERCHSLRELRIADVEMIRTREEDSISVNSDELDITECHSSPRLMDTPPISPQRASIRQLYIQMTPATSTTFIDQLLHASLWRSFVKLDVLDLDLIHFPYPKTIQRLLAATSSCTSHLRIRAYHTTSLGFHVHPTVPRVSYTFKVLPRTGNPSFVDMFQPFNRLHRQRTNCNVRSHPPNRWRGISDLRLEIELGDTFSLFERDQWEWAWLDEVLGGVRRKVSFVVVLTVPGEVEADLKRGMEGRIKECLPRSVERGVLRVRVQLL